MVHKKGKVTEAIQQTERSQDKQTHGRRQTDGPSDIQIPWRKLHTETNKHTNGLSNNQGTDSQEGPQTDRQTGKKTNCQTVQEPTGRNR